MDTQRSQRSTGTYPGRWADSPRYRATQSRVVEPTDVILVPREEHRLHCVQCPGDIGFPKVKARWRTRTCGSGDSPRRTSHSVSGAETARQRLAGTPASTDAVERWYLHGWSRLDARLRSSITEGVVVFLSLFDDNPRCTARSVHRGRRPTSRQRESRDHSRRSIP